MVDTENKKGGKTWFLLICYLQSMEKDKHKLDNHMNKTQNSSDVRIAMWYDKSI